MSKVIVITGAGAGLGRWLARRFAADGDKVAALGRTASKVEAVAAECGNGTLGIHCDVANPDSVRKAFAEIKARHGRVDVLINNAALFGPIPIDEASDQEIQDSININLTGPIYCMREAIPLMQPGSHIINVSSESVEHRVPFHVLYQCAKAGLEQVSKDLVNELGPLGIRITVVRAGRMSEEDRKWDFDPARLVRFRDACLAAGMKMETGAVTHFRSVPGIFRTIVDLPPDMHTDLVSLRAWRAG